MKTKTLLSLVIATASVLSDASAGSLTNFAIGLSPAYVSQESEQIERIVKKFVLDAPMGSQIRLDDAFNLRSIAAFNVQSVRFDSPANRVRALSTQFSALMQWFKEARNRAQTSGISNFAALRVPEYLDFLAGDAAGGRRGILLVGSPFMSYPSEPTFSMTNADEGPRVPSDGHLLAPLTASPYGCAERAGRLSGSRISWAYGGEQIWNNGLQKTLVTRFWTLFAKQQGAALIGFTPDLASAFAAVSQPDRAAVANFELNPEDTKIEMRVARPRRVPTWLPQAGADTNSPAASASPQPTNTPSSVATPTQLPAQPVSRLQPLSRNELSQPISATVDLGIMWESPDSGTDVDLYVRTRPGAEELSFQRVRSRDGVYVRDWTSPNNRTDFEWVKLNPGARLIEIEAWVNLYRGRGPISGRAAFHFENRVYTGSFHIPAASGNGGGDAQARERSPHWTRLNLHEILTGQP